MFWRMDEEEQCYTADTTAEDTPGYFTQDAVYLEDSNSIQINFTVNFQSHLGKLILVPPFRRPNGLIP